VAVKEVATAIGEHLGLPVAGIPAGGSAGHFGAVAGMFQLDVPASSAITRRLLGWRPAGPGILADLRMIACTADSPAEPASRRLGGAEPFLLRLNDPAPQFRAEADRSALDGPDMPGCVRDGLRGTGASCLCVCRVGVAVPRWLRW
jgi:hypothetical protein